MMKIRYAFLEETLGKGYDIDKFVDATMEEDEPDIELDQTDAMIWHAGAIMARLKDTLINMAKARN